jgi:O-6-methylguanine DNA methyltransferase
MKTSLTRATIQTPVGPMTAIATDSALAFLEYGGPGRQKLVAARLARWFPGAIVVDGRNAVIAALERWLRAYFVDPHGPKQDLPLDARGTAFERAVWREMQGIAPGRTRTYGALAQRLGKPNASRAVGGASRRNPISIIIPCHRVVGANGQLTGYGGGLEAKRWLLQHENRTERGS